MGCKKIDFYQEGVLEVNPNFLERGLEKKGSAEKKCVRAYRYGFNGMERDDEVRGYGNSYTTLYRQNDTRLGKWLSLDPKASQMPWQSPYNSMDNNPIIYTDVLGDKVKYQGKGARKEVRQARKRDDGFAQDFKQLKKDDDTYVFDYKGKTGDQQYAIGAENTFARGVLNATGANSGDIINPNIGVNPGGNPANHEDKIFLNFRSASDESISFGMQGGGSDNNGVSKSSQNYHTSGTLILTGGSNIDSGQDRVTITAPSGQVLYNGLLPAGQTNARFATVNFNLTRNSKIKVAVSNDDPKVAPGAFSLKVDIQGN